MTNEAVTSGSSASDAPEGERAALAAVGALMAERRQFEGWIAALDARRAITPPHVFSRVHDDYATRLSAVIVQLKAHADSLRLEIDSLATRLMAIEQDRQREQDERAEGELRAHVGELSAEAWGEMAAVSDEQLADLAARHAEVEDELARTRELLSEAERPAAPKAAVPIEAPVQQALVASDVGGDLEELAPADEEAGGVDVSSPDDAGGQSASSLPAELPPEVIAAEQELLDRDERAANAPSASSGPMSTPPRSSRFDELAFLSSVVNTPSGTFEAAPTDRPDEAARRDSFATRAQDDQIVNLNDDRGRTLDGPLGGLEREGDRPAGPASGTPSLATKDKLLDGAKTLKCGECGAMNYPTEWYCERCGAELASL
jgi:hypothetical protein